MNLRMNLRWVKSHTSEPEKPQVLDFVVLNLVKYEPTYEPAYESGVFVTLLGMGG